MLVCPRHFVGVIESQLTLYKTFPKELKTTIYRSKIFPFNNSHRIDKKKSPYTVTVFTF